MNSFTFFLILIPILAGILLAVNILFATHSPYQEKDSVFECGFHSFLGQNRSQFSISFFIFALLFLLFDLEILLIYPYIVSTNYNAIYGLAIMLIFFILLTLGFVFELGKKALTIDSRQLKNNNINLIIHTNLHSILVDNLSIFKSPYFILYAYKLSDFVFNIHFKIKYLSSYITVNGIKLRFFLLGISSVIFFAITINTSLLLNIKNIISNCDILIIIPLFIIIISIIWKIFNNMFCEKHPIISIFALLIVFICIFISIYIFIINQDITLLNTRRTGISIQELLNPDNSNIQQVSSGTGGPGPGPGGSGPGPEASTGHITQSDNNGNEDQTTTETRNNDPNRIWIKFSGENKKFYRNKEVLRSAERISKYKKTLKFKPKNPRK